MKGSLRIEIIAISHILVDDILLYRYIKEYGDRNESIETYQKFQELTCSHDIIIQRQY
jgi:hypothetical protein